MNDSFFIFPTILAAYFKTGNILIGIRKGYEFRKLVGTGFQITLECSNGGFTHTTSFTMSARDNNKLASRFLTYSLWMKTLNKWGLLVHTERPVKRPTIALIALQTIFQTCDFLFASIFTYLIMFNNVEFIIIVYLTSDNGSQSILSSTILQVPRSDFLFQVLKSIVKVDGLSGIEFQKVDTIIQGIHQNSVLVEQNIKT